MSPSHTKPLSTSAVGGAGSGGDEDEEQRRRNRQRVMERTAATARKERLAKLKRGPKEKTNGRGSLAPQAQLFVPRQDVDDAFQGKCVALCPPCPANTL
jgi:hypothetical protein